MPTAKQVKMRRGSTLDNDLFTGAEGEITVDLTVGTARVHDGLKMGGNALALGDLTNVPEDTDFEQRIMAAVQALIAAGGGGSGTGEEDMPIGSVTNSFINPGVNYLPANGDLVKAADYPSLYSAIGRKYGTDASQQISGTTGGPLNSGINSVSGMTPGTAALNMPNFAINGNTVVAGSNAGMVMVSQDNGTTWSVVDTGMATNIMGLGFANGKFVAVGLNKIAYSTNGTSWTLITSITATFTYLQVLNNRFFAFAATTCYMSTDGVNWSPFTLTGFTSTAPNCWFYSTVFSRYYVGGASGALSSSTDGTTWTAATSNMTNAINAIAQSPTTLVLVGGVSTTANIAYSTNGTTFTAATNTIANIRYNVIWFPAANLFFTAGNNGVGQTSPDGITWTNVTLPVSGSPLGYANLVTVTADGTTVVATTSSSGSVVITSTDLVNWTSRDSTMFRRPGLTRFYAGNNGVNWYVGNGGISRSYDNFRSAYWVMGAGVSYAGYRALASDGVSTVFTSFGNGQTDPDPTTPFQVNQFATSAWTSDLTLFNPVPIITGVGCQAFPDQVLNLGGKWLAWGNLGGLSVSSDGKNWTSLRTFSASTHVTKVAFGNGKYVAVGTAGQMFYSTDAATWTACTHTYGTNNIYDVKWVAPQNKFYAVGDLTGHAMSSTDGITWTDVNMNNTSIATYYRVSYTKDRLVFMGGTAFGSNKIVSMPHSDMTNISYGVIPVRFEKVDGGDHAFVCGSSTTISGTAYPVVYYSADGIGWTSTVLTAPTGLLTGSILDVNWMGDGYFAVGLTGAIPTAWSSPNGLNWTMKPLSTATATASSIFSPQNGVFGIGGSTSGTNLGATYNSTPDGKFRLPTIVPAKGSDGDPYIRLA